MPPAVPSAVSLIRPGLLAAVRAGPAWAAAFDGWPIGRRRSGVVAFSVGEAVKSPPYVVDGFLVLTCRSEQRHRSGAAIGRDRDMARAARPPTDDAGFSIAEVMVASMVAVILFVIFSVSINLSVDQMRDTAYRTEAAGIATERMETARTYTWEQIGMPVTDQSAPLLTDDGRLSGTATGIAEDEDLIVDSRGLIYPVGLETVDDVEYVVWSYVSNAASGSRRLVVQVLWDVEGRAGSYLVSTLIAKVAL